jgi:hypothetical protein
MSHRQTKPHHLTGAAAAELAGPDAFLWVVDSLFALLVALALLSMYFASSSPAAPAKRKVEREARASTKAELEAKLLEARKNAQAKEAAKEAAHSQATRAARGGAATHAAAAGGAGLVDDDTDDKAWLLESARAELEAEEARLAASLRRRESPLGVTCAALSRDLLGLCGAIRDNDAVWELFAVYDSECNLVPNSGAGGGGGALPHPGSGPDAPSAVLYKMRPGNTGAGFTYRMDLYFKNATPAACLQVNSSGGSGRSGRTMRGGRGGVDDAGLSGCRAVWLSGYLAVWLSTCLRGYLWNIDKGAFFRSFPLFPLSRALSPTPPPNPLLSTRSQPQIWRPPFRGQWDEGGQERRVVDRPDLDGTEVIYYKSKPRTMIR